MLYQCIFAPWRGDGGGQMIVLDKHNIIPYLREHYPAFDAAGASVSAIGDDEEDSQGLINYLFQIGRAHV